MFQTQGPAITLMYDHFISPADQQIILTLRSAGIGNGTTDPLSITRADFKRLFSQHHFHPALAQCLIRNNGSLAYFSDDGVAPDHQQSSLCKVILESLLEAISNSVSTQQ